MKKVSTLFILILAASTTIAQDTKNFEWLLGTWEKIQSRPGTNTTESWIQNDDGTLVGLGVTKKGSDTVFIEKLSLVTKNGIPYYVADIGQGQLPTYFEITSTNRFGFIAENPKHDFPKKIEYKKEGDNLIATISGDGKQIPFEFTRKN